MKRTLLFLFCALISTQMFSETLFGHLFPTLAYLERTSCHYMEGNEQNRTLNRLSFEDNMFEIDGNYYIEYNDMWLREDKEGRILVYSEPAKKDLVLYDFTLEIGDTLTTLNVDIVPMTEGDPILPGVKPVVVDYPIHLDEYVSFPIDTLIVTDVSMVMMCDSNQYKKWTFSNGMEYMEYIGNLGADFFAIIRNPWEELPTCCVEEDLVCASIYDRLVYLMDDEKRDLLNIDCPCTSWSNKWQWRTNTWNVLQFDGMAFEQTAQTWQYELAHDTIIGGKEYTAVTRHWTAYDESAAEYVAAVRFAENKKAFIYYDNAEYLLYDFGYHEIGDTLEVFSGINNYEHFKTYKCVITDNYSTAGGIAEDTYVMDIIDPIIGNTIPAAMIWEEFVGSYSGFLHGGLLVPGNSNYQLLCAYKDNVLAYSVDNDAFTDNDTFIEYGCEYNAEQKPKDLFPTLWGLQRTDIEEHTTCDGKPYLSDFEEYVTTQMNGKLYLSDGRNYLREENNQVLFCCPDFEIYEDIVLYDWTLEIGDTLPHNKSTVHAESDFIVKNVSTVTLLDGKKYKKWTLACGYEYIEGIGAINGEGYGHYLCLESWVQPGTYIRTCLVCASKNGQLLYQMDDTEMERLGAECLCEYNDGPKKDNAKDGKIGGRPTPTQWNMLEMVVREMENNKTILQAETFSYTLEDNSRILNNKTYFDLARQSTRDTAITKSVVGALHFSEDEGNRVYFLCDGMEYLLYDFTAEPGDSIEIFAGINNYPQATIYTHVVTGKDTLENGACRMVLEVVFPNQTGGTNLQKVWLAGLGSLDGIVHNSAQLASNARSAETESSVMLCAWREDDCLYTTDHPEFDKVGCVYNLPTAVDDIQTSENQYQKIIHNGHLYILRNNKIYDVLGTPLTNH